MKITSMWTVISKCEENKNFAPKQNERDCPMITKKFYFTTWILTREDVKRWMSHQKLYTKANRFKDASDRDAGDRTDAAGVYTATDPLGSVPGAWRTRRAAGPSAAAGVGAVCDRLSGSV